VWPASPRRPCGGEELTYRFVKKQAGSYWYHSHQVSHEQVIGGLLGPLVVRPRHRDAAGTDVVALLHTYDGTASVNGRSPQTVDARPGQRVRLRVVNTDNGPTRAWAGTPYRVLAVDGHEVDRPTRVTGRATVVTAGGRVDIEVVAPRDGSGARVQVGSSTWVDVGDRAPNRDAAPAAAAAPPAVLRLPGPRWASTPPQRSGTSPTTSAGRPSDVVRVHIENDSGDVHPMHLHGHHTVVLSRNGTPATGSPWWFDSLNVLDGRATTSPSSPTTPVSGWITATTSSTPTRGWSCT
jgi:FtsP/CotA-like multicopper oxidase with cupredoxin domain